jgi:glucose/arabinose dehydrogenase
MYMLLMGLCLTFFGLAVTAAAFAASTRPSASLPATQPELPAVKASPARFFSERASSAVPVPPQVPIEVLLQQLENHVRLEQAAAESFVAFPTQALLHSKTSSPFVN